MNRVKICRVGLLPLVLGVAACSDMDSGEDTFRRIYPNLVPAAGSAGDGPTGNAGSGGSAGSGGAGGDGAGDMPAEWRCITEEDEPVPAPPPTDPPMPPRVTYLTPIVDFDSPSPMAPLPVPNLQITVCTSPSCNPPAACWPDAAACEPGLLPPPPVASAPVRIGQPNAMAPFLFGINMPRGFDSVSIRARADGYVPAEYFVGGPMNGPPEGGNIVVGLPYFLLTEAALNTLYSQVELLTPWDESRGILAVRTINCDRSPTPFNPDPSARQATRGQGVRLEMLSGEPEPPASPFVLSFGKRATKQILVTDDRGTAGFANIEPGDYLVRGIAPAPVNSDEGTPFGRTPVTVRPGLITIIEVRDGLEVWGQ